MIISNYLRIPFKRGGRHLNDGLDCYGLIRHALKQECNINLPLLDILDLNATPADYLENAKADNYSYIVDIPQKYDIVVMSAIDTVLHFGIMVDGYNFIHMRRCSGVTKSTIEHPLIKPKIIEYRRCYDNDS